MSDKASTATPIKQLWAFVVLVFVMSIPAYVLAAFAPQEMVMLLALILAPAPILAALIVTFRAGGSAGAKRLLKRAFDWRQIKSKGWYVPILVLMPALFLLALALTVFLGVPVPESLFPLVAAPVALLLFFVFALFEEVGWMGYAWGYALWAASGAISVYISIILWFSERKCVYPAQGALL